MVNLTNWLLSINVNPRKTVRTKVRARYAYAHIAILENMANLATRTIAPPCNYFSREHSGFWVVIKQRTKYGDIGLELHGSI